MPRFAVPDKPLLSLRKERLPKSLSPQEKVTKLAEAWSDPMDTRLPHELARDLQMDEGEVSRILADPSFLGPVTERFLQALGGARVLVIKALMRASIGGDKAATRLVAQILGTGVPGAPGTPVGEKRGGSGDYFSDLTSDQLDQEIRRLLLASAPEEVDLVRGEVIPVEDATDGGGESAQVGRVDESGEEGEAGETPLGEDPETGGQ